MDTARIEWWKTDTNKDGKLQYSEFPHPDWKRANRNNDDVVDWAEEVSDRVLKKLAQEGDFLAKHGNDSQKQWPSIYAWGVAHPGLNRSSTSSIGIAMERSPRRNTRPLRISWTLTTIHPSRRPTRKDKPAKTFGRREGSGKKPKGDHEDEPNRTRTLCKWRPPSAKRSWPGHGRCGPLSIRIATSIWQHREFPHPDWKRANRDGDDELLSWKEELADRKCSGRSRAPTRKHIRLGFTKRMVFPSGVGKRQT